MGATTPNLALYKPGGGSTGTIVPDERVDIDKINGNMDLIDAFAGSVQTELPSMDADILAMQTTINGLGVWKDYTPVLTASGTNPNTGVGAVLAGRYAQIGKVVHCRGRIKFGTSGTSVGSGTYRISLPVNSAVVPVTTNVIGNGTVQGVVFDLVTAMLLDNTKMTIRNKDSSVSDSWGLSSNAEILWNITYEAE